MKNYNPVKFSANLTKKRHWLYSLLFFAILFLIFLLIIYCKGKRNLSDLVIKRHDVYLERLAPEHNNIKIALISDLHLKANMFDNRILDKITVAINAENPDLIFHLGDFVNRYLFKNLSYYEVTSVLSRFKSKYATFAITGNHDTKKHMDNGLRTALTNARIIVLENRGINLMINKVPLKIAGINYIHDYPSSLDETQPFVHPNRFNILLSHTPDVFDEADFFDLIVSGHTHGGQIRLPIIGAKYLFYNKANMEYFDSGIYQNKNRKLAITSGVGTSLLDIRILCPPEIMILTLKSGNPPEHK